MKKVFALCGAALLLSPTLGSATRLTVQVQQGQLRSEPSFFGKIISNVHYHNSVDVLEERGPWRLVKFKQKQGWMHISALINPSVKLSAGQNISDAVSSKDVALAGKGFTKEVENEFKKQHSDLSFTWVDNMENINITPSELERFAAEGDFSTISR